MVSISGVQLLFAGSAALFAFISIIIGLAKWRWDAVDSELERERKIKRRLIGQSTEVQYEQEKMPRSVARTVENTFGGERGSADIFESVGDDPSFEFEVIDVLVTEDSGISYGLSKLKDGFQGTTEITIKSWRNSGFGGGGPLEFPPDIALLSDSRWEIEVNLEEYHVIPRVNSADESEVQEVMKTLFSFIESEFGGPVLDWDS